MGVGGQHREPDQNVSADVEHQCGGEDRKLYGMDESNRAILHGDVPAPAVSSVLTSELEQYRHKEHS